MDADCAAGATKQHFIALMLCPIFNIVRAGSLKATLVLRGGVPDLCRRLTHNPPNRQVGAVLRFGNPRQPEKNNTKRCKPTRGHQVAAQSVSKIVEHTVAVTLKHLGMDVEAGVAQLCNFLGQEFHSIDGVAENNGLVNAQLRGGGAREQE